MDNRANNFDNGGWDSNLAGIWVGKYEPSHSDASSSNTGSSTKIKIVPNVQSWRNITIGNCYTNAYNYDRNKESHLIKNSEWGAITYLTHSGYGRNGYEIDINNSTSYITGNGGGSPGASEKAGIINAYNSNIGQKASSTGNIYGIYDLSGGAWEYIACFNSADTGNCELKYGSSFAGINKDSTKYATRYKNDTTIDNGTKIYEVGKIGDSTKEAYKGTSYYEWLQDYSNFVCATYPFFLRGGNCRSVTNAGIFCLDSYPGNEDSAPSFRVVLTF